MATRWIADTDGLLNVSDATIVVLPLGATEQHGPHLPLETDSIIAEGICMRLKEMAADDLDVRMLPVEQIGYSLEHMDHKGSRTLAFDEAINNWIATGEAAAKRGVRRFVMMNAHGGNSPLMTVVAQELRVRCNMLAVATKWDRFIKGSSIIPEREEALGIHGGDIETSVMLALRPDLVRMDQARDFTNLQEHLSRDFEHLRAYGSSAFGWKAADLNRDGVTGNAAAATAEKGEALLALATHRFAELLTDVRAFDLTLLR